MNDIIVLDASVVIPAVSKNERHHSEALAFIQELKTRAGRLEVPATFLLELYAVLNRSPREVRKLGFFTIDDPLYVELRPVDEGLVSSFLNWMESKMPGQSPTRGADLAYVAVAVDANLPLVTLDNGLRSFKDAGLAVYTPQEKLDEWNKGAG
ncbi:MAG: PIN domain-containing protein [Candidatus Aminicenantes bacterium]|nr:PIN domain-containing protein [Candidatus Aminicenantes bacterium]